MQLCTESKERSAKGRAILAHIARQVTSNLRLYIGKIKKSSLCASFFMELIHKYMCTRHMSVCTQVGTGKPASADMN